MRIAVVGSGISGIATAGILKRFGHQPVLYERSDQIGGIWAHSYPQVRLQNSAAQYHFADFPWPFPPDVHPTAEQIHRYLRAAVDHLGLEVRRRHEVVSMELDAAQEAWTLEA